MCSEGIGIDIIEIDRIAESIKTKAFVERIFTLEEREYCAEKVERYAGRFAAKEACAKAIGEGIGKFGWHDFEILADSKNKPFVRLSALVQRAYPNACILVSIAHNRTCATAVALLKKIDS